MDDEVHQSLCINVNGGERGRTKKTGSTSHNRSLSASQHSLLILMFTKYSHLTCKLTLLQNIPAKNPCESWFQLSLGGSPDGLIKPFTITFTRTHHLHTNNHGEIPLLLQSGWPADTTESWPRRPHWTDRDRVMWKFPPPTASEPRIGCRLQIWPLLCKKRNNAPAPSTITNL